MKGADERLFCLDGYDSVTGVAWAGSRAHVDVILSQRVSEAEALGAQELRGREGAERASGRGGEVVCAVVTRKGVVLASPVTAW